MKWEDSDSVGYILGDFSGLVELERKEVLCNYNEPLSILGHIFTTSFGCDETILLRKCLWKLED